MKSHFKKSRRIGLVGLIFLLSSVSLLSGKSEQKPNIILIFIDDMGWPALSCYGNRRIETRNIDRLAREGMRFIDAYVTPQCTPSRASLLTGQHTARNKMWHVIGYYGYPYAKVQEPEFRLQLSRDTYTLGKALKDNGYTTAHLGKWHLTNNEDGYYTYLKESGKHYYGFDYVNPMTDPTEYQSYGDKGVDFLTDEAIGFMERNREPPFFIYLSHHTIHGPVLAPEEKVNHLRYKGFPRDGLHNATYMAALQHMDDSVGRLLDKVDQLGMTENTVILFLSDNGGVDGLYDNNPLRAGKGSPYEGGIRVPFLVRWPGVVFPGSVCQTPVHVTDLYPTLVDMAGGSMRQDHILDGRSIIPLLKQKGQWNRDVLYWYMPLYDHLWGATPAAVIREGDYKLIEFFGDYIDIELGYKYIPEGRLELYNVREDLSETNDLSRSMPEKARTMRKKLHDWIQSMGESIPQENPYYDPARVLDKITDKQDLPGK
jgi:arylsulfatase A